jgi:hypothetical protein
MREFNQENRPGRRIRVSAESAFENKRTLVAKIVIEIKPEVIFTRVVLISSWT